MYFLYYKTQIRKLYYQNLSFSIDAFLSLIVDLFPA